MRKRRRTKTPQQKQQSDGSNSEGDATPRVNRVRPAKMNRNVDTPATKIATNESKKESYFSNQSDARSTIGSMWQGFVSYMSTPEPESPSTLGSKQRVRERHHQASNSNTPQDTRAERVAARRVRAAKKDEKHDEAASPTKHAQNSMYKKRVPSAERDLGRHHSNKKRQDDHEVLSQGEAATVAVIDESKRSSSKKRNLFKFLVPGESQLENTDREPEEESYQ